MQFKSVLLFIAAVSAANALPAAGDKAAIVASKIDAIKDAIVAAQAELGADYKDKAKRDLKDSLTDLAASVELISATDYPGKVCWQC